MAPEHIVVRLTVVPEVRLKEQLDAAQPHSPKAIAEQFLSYLSLKKRWLGCRCNQPLDPEPETLGRTCLNCLAESRWRKRAEAFYTRTYPEAVVFAEAILEDLAEAEDMVAEEFIEVFEGETEPRYFFRHLKMRCRNRLKKLARQEASPSPEADELLEEQSWREAARIAASLDRVDQSQDPAEVLVGQRDYRRLRRLIARAKEIAANDRKYRWIKRKEWAKDLNLGQKSA